MPMDYEGYIARKFLIGLFLLLLTLLVSLYSLSHGSYSLSTGDVINTLLGREGGNAYLIVWKVRLPRIVAALFVGASLAVSGAVMQGFLRNPWRVRSQWESPTGLCSVPLSP